MAKTIGMMVVVVEVELVLVESSINDSVALVVHEVDMNSMMHDMMMHH